MADAEVVRTVTVPAPVLVRVTVAPATFAPPAAGAPVAGSPTVVSKIWPEIEPSGVIPMFVLGKVSPSVTVTVTGAPIPKPAFVAVTL